MKNMNQKSLLLATIAASSLLLTACGSGSTTDNNDSPPEGTRNNQALFRPVSGVIPLPSNFFFAGQDAIGQPADGTLNIPSSNPAAIAANELDGWSTVAPITFTMSAPIDPSSIQPGVNVRMFNVCLNIVTTAPEGAGPDLQLVPTSDYSVSVAATNPAQLIIKPTAPLRAAIDLTLDLEQDTGPAPDCNDSLSDPEQRNGYIAIVTNTLTGMDGRPFAASNSYLAAKSGAPLFDGTGPTPAGLSFGFRTAADAGQMERVRQLTNGVEMLAAGISAQVSQAPQAPPGVNPADIIVSTIFATQSVGATLGTLVADGGLQPSVIPSQNTGLTTADVLPALFGLEDNETNRQPFGFAAIHAGSISLPYYLAPAASPQSTAPITTSWCIDTTDANGNPTCGSTTLASAAAGNNLRENGPNDGKITMPVLITVPTQKSGFAPENGDRVPTVIFQHGITADRSSLLLIADALARAGLAAIAIDHPLHGITAQSGSNALRIEGIERTFDLDLLTETRNSDGSVTTTPGSDGVQDSSGAHYFNLPNLLVSRDNLRQSVVDLLNVAASIVNPDNTSLSDGNGNTFNLSGGTSYLGHSLGGIVGTPFLGLAPPFLVGNGTLAMPGGGIAKLLDGSAAFGPRISAGLADAGAVEGSPDYETFLSFAQQAVDTVDPVNWARRASLQHDIHVIEVVGGGGTNANGTPALSDLVVPNAVPNVPPLPGEVVIESGPLGGTDPLIEALGIPIVTASTAGSGAVQFDKGDHSSILSPATDCPTTVEMQTQTAAFLRLGQIPIGASDPSVCAAFAR